jgi:FtsH-binding integral membrane protein
MLDLRLPIGLMFSLVGGLLAIYGLVTWNDPKCYQCSLGININLWWGLILTVFGLVMWIFARRAARQEKDQPS